MNNLTRNVFYILLAITLIACSKGPSGSTIDSALQQYVINNSIEGVFIIKNITKTNGYMLNGIYNLEISFERHFLVDINDVVPGARNMLGKNKGSKPEVSLDNALSLFMYAGFIETYGLFSKGDIYKLNHLIRFIDTENGWKVYGE